MLTFWPHIISELGGVLYFPDCSAPCKFNPLYLSWVWPWRISFSFMQGVQSCRYVPLAAFIECKVKRRSKREHVTLQMYMVNLWSLYRQILYKIQTTAHKMKYTLFPVIFMVILRSCYCENPLKLWKMEYRGWVPKFATGLYIIIRNEFMFNFLRRLDSIHENQLISNFIKAL